MFIDKLFKMLLFKGGVLIYAEHCMFIALIKSFPFTILRACRKRWKDFKESAFYEKKG